MIHCHLVIGSERLEALVCFVARHLTELLADAFVTTASEIAIRVDHAPPSQHFIGGRLHDSLPPCLLTIHHPPQPGEPLVDALRPKIKHFLGQTFGSPILDSQIRLLPVDPPRANIPESATQ